MLGTLGTTAQVRHDQLFCAINRPPHRHFYSHTHSTLLLPHFLFLYSSYGAAASPLNPNPNGGIPEPIRRRTARVWVEGHFEYRLVTLEDGMKIHQVLYNWPGYNKILVCPPTCGIGHLVRHLNTHQLPSSPAPERRAPWPPL